MTGRIGAIGKIAAVVEASLRQTNNRLWNVLPGRWKV